MVRIIGAASACLCLLATSAFALQAAKLNSENEVEQSAYGNRSLSEDMLGSAAAKYTNPASSSCERCIKYRPSHKLLFVGVFTAPSYRERRDEVRHSWMQDEMLQDTTSPVKAKFILGSIKNHPRRQLLMMEQARYGDMVFLDIEDSYDNLPAKTLAYFRWFKQHQEHKFKYAMKLDDDTFPNFNLIVPTLHNTYNEHQFVYYGGLQWHGPVQKDGKWAESKEFKAMTYPAYAAGSGYALSRNLVDKLEEVRAERPDEIQMLRNEDTTIGSFVHHENWRSMVVEYVDVKHEVFGCSDGVHLAMNLWPGEMKCMWDKRKHGETAGPDHEINACCRPLEKYGLWRQGQMKPPPS